MSLILEALKKSEQQRRLGEAPTLSSPVLNVRRGRSLLPLFGGLIVIALATGWWLLRPASTPPPAQATTAASVDAAVHTPAATMSRIKPTSPPLAPNRTAEAKREAIKPMASGLEAVAPPLPITPPINDRPGSVTQLPLPRAAASAAAAATAAAATKPAAAPATTPPPAKAVATAPAAVHLPPPALPATGAQPAAPVAAAPILPSIWELPYATRKDLPDLTLTMHVYASDPHARFVVIKGERHIEGDDLGDGVILREIRADGMVLEYKGTRFLSPRG